MANTIQEAPQPNGGIDLTEEHRKIMEMQQRQSLDNMRMQAAQHAQTERLSTISNMMKTAHDSQMVIINNSKG